MISKFLIHILVALLFGIAVYVTYDYVWFWRPNAHQWQMWRAIFSAVSFYAGTLYVATFNRN